MKGAIIINRFRIPYESVFQAERLKTEFKSLGVDIDIIDCGYLYSMIKDNKLISNFSQYNFVVYLDKDKYLSAMLEKTGVKLFNSHSAIRLCDDKAETYIALADKGVNIPDTLFGALCYSKDCNINQSDADAIIDKLGLPIIVKESYGSMGKGIYLAHNKSELIEIMEKVKLKPHLFQKYLSYKVGVDVRIIVIGGKVVASMERRNDSDFRSNVAQGGTGVAINLSENFKALAQKVSNILGLDYCGVDIIYGENGTPYVCEVNSNAFIGGIEKATDINIAKKYAEHILKNL
jgi:RimK family alpha-L-glutamate ligase